MTWLPVVGFEDIYEVSDAGLVRKRYRTRRIADLKYIKGFTNKQGYNLLSLNDNNRKRSILRHHVVLEAFIGFCPENMEGSHLDGDPSNNCVENLIWESRSDNAKRRRPALGEKSRNHKLTELEVLKIRALYAEGRGLKSLGREFNVSYVMIRYIVQRKNWTHI